ncbi:hypothetical protein KGNDJEFE_01214 [Peptacetobacter hiranonis]|nr:hypothetical protein KGNDJEFE_01214 [Peptacetobacter hiranonis]
MMDVIMIIRLLVGIISVKLFADWCEKQIQK